MAVTPSQAAKRFCERSNWSLTNLQLQKMLYIAQMYFMGANDGRRLIDGQFQAWHYGPVSHPVYQRVRAFGSSPIGNVFRVVMPADEGEETAFLDEMYETLKTWTPGQLVSFTHKRGGAWDRFYDPHDRDVVIPDRAIIDEYKTLHAA